MLAIYTRYWSYIYPLLVISTQCSVGHIHSLAQKRLQPHAQLRRDFLYWSPCLHALSLKSFYPIQINYLVRISLLLIYDGFCVKATSSSVYFILQWSLFSQCGFDQKERWHAVFLIKAGAETCKNGCGVYTDYWGALIAMDGQLVIWNWLRQQWIFSKCKKPCKPIEGSCLECSNPSLALQMKMQNLLQVKNCWDFKNAHKVCTGTTLHMIRKLIEELICFIWPNGKDTYWSLISFEKLGEGSAQFMQCGHGMHK